MFANLRINIFVYYFLTVSTFLAVLHYFLSIVVVENTFLLSVIMLSLVSLSAVFISKLAIDPLQEHVQNLQNLSKETLHELNLPISTINTNIHLLKKNITNEKDLRRLKRIEGACSMLEQRYNELDYMIKTQSLAVVKETIDLGELLLQRVDFFKAMYPNFTFNTSLQKVIITNDIIGLSKVIDNIIDNAVKYSKNKKEIDIQLQDFTITIKDYGKGMDEVELLKIFDNYYQSNSNMKGFGIGLAMVKRFCDANKINLNFISKPDIGTSVQLNFKETK